LEESLSLYQKCLRFASVSTNPLNKEEVRGCAQWLQELISGWGLEAQLYETPGHPILVAKNQHVPGLQTVLLYGHYDVQPAEPLEEWKTPPFEPTILGDRMYCRGATDNKGQFMAHLCGIKKTLDEEGKLPVNLVLLIEGEEEIGSPNLKPFLEKMKAELKCDLVAISDTGMVAPGMGTLTYGLRGIACLEIKVKGPTIDLHSGIFGGAVPNSITELVRLLACLHDEEGHVQVPGFYDDVEPLKDWEVQAWSLLPDDTQEMLDLTGVKELKGEAGYSHRAHRWARPTAELNGIGGGYQGEGSKTVIAKEAFAKLSFRLVPEQKPDEVSAAVRRFLEERAHPSVRVEVKLGHTGAAYLSDPFSEYGKAAQAALKLTFAGHEIALIREGGSIPIVQAFKEVLDADSLLLGLALPDAQCHAPNENFPLENFKKGIELNQFLFKQLANLKTV
jgi:acetylornithine deacetylase/succinyl-diaminopimelate desuccinylase-like protein